MDKCFKCKVLIVEESPVQGLHEKCFLEWFGLEEIQEFEHIFQPYQQSVEEKKIPDLHTSFFQGKFKKYSARLQNKSYILKVKEEDYPELPLVEYTCNLIARALGLSVPDFYLIRFLNEVDTFVTRNFMEDHASSNLIHLYHFVQEKETFDCSTIISIIEKKLGHIRDIKSFVHLCLFDALIGNHDRHGRNLGFIESPKGLSFAPFYDNPSYIGIEDQMLLGALHSPRGKISTQVSPDPTIRDYVQEFTALGLKEFILSFRKKLLKVPILQIIDDGFYSEKRKRALHILIESRIKEFEDALTKA